MANPGWAIEKPVSLIISDKSEGSSQLQSSAWDRLGSPLPPHMSHRPTDSFPPALADLVFYSFPRL